MIRSFTFAMILSMTLTACQGNPFKRNQAQGGDELFDDALLAPVGLQASPAQRFPDVPLPVNAKEDADRTYVFESKSIQVGRMVYTIKEPINDVAQFYIRECQNIGWTMDSALQAQGITLIFNRPGKRLVVSVTSSGLSNRGSLLILNYTPHDDSTVLDTNSIQSSPL